MRGLSFPVKLAFPVAARRFLPLFFVIFALLSLATAGYFFFQYQKTQNLLKNPSVLGANEVKAIVSEVGKLIQLPQNEDPTIATVSDKSKLSDQPFFKSSENGDKVLIYTKSKKAILYRPSISKIIEVAPVNLGDNQPQGQEVAGASTSAVPSPSTAPIQSKTVVILNGTTQAGLASSTKTTIEGKVTNVKVIRTGDSKGDFSETIVVDLKNNPVVAKAIVDAIGGKVGDLPSGETKPSDADFLIIVGK